LRRIDSRTLRIEIPGTIAAKVVLCPPLGAPLSGVTIGGIASAGFDAHSATIAHTPAIVLCTT
jgi:hypothetical protein